MRAQTVPDAEIVAAIAGIKAIDNHTHPERVLADGEIDKDWDAFPDDAYRAPRVAYIPANTRPGNPNIVASWRALWGITDQQWSKEAVKTAMENKLRIKREKGDSYPAWVLDQAGVDIALSNRITMHASLPSARFRWVPYADLYMFPLSTRKIQKDNPLYGGFYEGLEQRAKGLLRESGKKTIPATLSEWLANVVRPIIEKEKREGAIAIKYTAAYYRPLDFAPVAEQDANTIYAKFAHNGTPGMEDYKKLQDFIFYEVARIAARLQLPVHIHCGVGAGAQYNLGGANPFLLEKAFINLPDTDFVLTHGGWPYSFQATGLLGKSNVFVDFSAQEFFLSPRNLADTLRYWMDYMPEKVLFGTDAYPNPALPQAAWEEFEWVNTRLAREALAIALTEMRNDGHITTERAKELARMVLRDNTAKLHHL
jgi:predicted TIM-barrel fold metal-dependent hydrolase